MSVRAVRDGAIGLHLDWLRDRGRADLYVGARRQVLRRLEAALPCLAAGATEEHLQAWADRRRRELSPQSWCVELAHVRGFYGWTRRRGLREDDPTEEIGVPKLPKRLPRPVADHVFADILAAVTDPTDRVILLLAYEEGMRRAEIASLSWSGVDLRAGTARFVGKGDRERVVPLTQETTDSLTALPHRRGPVVRRRDGMGPITTPGGVAQRVRKYLPEDTTLHMLRHSAGTKWAREGGLRVAQELLGHSSPSTTALYARVDPGDAMDVVEATSIRHRSTRSRRRRAVPAGNWS